MMQYCYYIKLTGPPFWTWRVWGLNRIPIQSPSHFAGIFLYFLSGVFEILDSELFQDNFMMALHTFEEVSDQCHANSWAVQETGMLPLLSCDSDMTAW